VAGKERFPALQQPHGPHDRSLVKGFGFINEHDGDIVLDFIKQSAFVANEPISLFVQIDISFALWTSEDFKKLLADCHCFVSFLQRLNPGAVPINFFSYHILPMDKVINVFSTGSQPLDIGHGNDWKKFTVPLGMAGFDRGAYVPYSFGHFPLVPLDGLTSDFD
jgi:hypothetical protein